MAAPVLSVSRLRKSGLLRKLELSPQAFGFVTNFGDRGSCKRSWTFEISIVKGASRFSEPGSGNVRERPLSLKPPWGFCRAWPPREERGVTFSRARLALLPAAPGG
eukprot:CAMPEP_0176298528 /NCGR_PEP_ID=MMETSP0121_2-20121125/59304_1 /TAXON_ID=160619 /ORGANISM="Kryptoperidinium foliaceum, Strain CCMP 1326" /LENGTH=105 /DNA_ID=CAMNT_0017639791 /DNA_START=72 /DNA_END=386 /DNA_ORIENTATION=+